MPILKLRGGVALSAFRRAKLESVLRALHPGLSVAAATFWHFVETERASTPGESEVLAQLLHYGEPQQEGGPDPDGALYLVVPRLGTISPWASKATDIAHSCGLAHVARIERGIAYRIAGARRARCASGRSAPRPHDRDRARLARGRRGALPPLCAAAARDRAGAGRGTRRARAGERGDGPRALARRDRLPARGVPPPGPRSDRRRAHHVRAGELRALPAQDLQRVVGDRRRAAGREPLRDDPHHPRAQSAGHGARVLGQRGGDRGTRGAALVRREPTAATPSTAS